MTGSAAFNHKAARRVLHQQNRNSKNKKTVIMDTNDKARAEAAVSKEAAKVSAQAAKRPLPTKSTQSRTKPTRQRKKAKTLWKTQKRIFQEKPKT